VTGLIAAAVSPPPQAAAGIRQWSSFTGSLFIACDFDVPGMSAVADVITMSGDLYSPFSGEGIVDYRDQVQATAAKLGAALTVYACGEV
jgi:hypothetical protein